MGGPTRWCNSCGNLGQSDFGAASAVDMLEEGGGSIVLRNENGQATVELDAFNSDGDGFVRTQVLEITGGSDLSEQFDIRSDDRPPEAGMLVSIDPQEPGRLVLSDSAYDRTAAGVISGAGGRAVVGAVAEHQPAGSTPGLTPISRRCGPAT